ncbi:hypothetical protein SFR_0426 [Streptomyces sp. FR-008]|nr:hypothetical protein SFR_0426 [Streptomyces sp. FR-008]
MGTVGQLGAGGPAAGGGDTETLALALSAINQ